MTFRLLGFLNYFPPKESFHRHWNFPFMIKLAPVNLHDTPSCRQCNLKFSSLQNLKLCEPFPFPEVIPTSRWSNYGKGTKCHKAKGQKSSAMVSGHLDMACRRSVRGRWTIVPINHFAIPFCQCPPPPYRAKR